MKRTLSILVAAAVVFCSAISCSSKSAPEKLDELVAEVEAKASDLSSSDWSKYNEKYKALVDEIMDKESEYTDDEKKLALGAMGRYQKEVLKMYANGGLDIIKDIAAGLPAAFDGLLDGDDLTDKLKGLFDEDKLEDLGDNLEDAMENLGENLEETMENLGDNLEDAMENLGGVLENLFGGK